MDRRIAPSARTEEAIERVLLDGLDDPDALSQLGRLGAQRRSSLTDRISTWSLALPGNVQTRIGIPVRVTARPMTTWGRSGR